MFLSFVLLVGVCLAAPVEKLDECKQQTINLNGPYSLPLTYLTNSSYCSYKFNVPTGQFAYAKVVVYDMNGDVDEMVFINDVDNLVSMVFHANDLNGGTLTKWNNTAAWPQTFIVKFQPGRDTAIKYQFDISLQKNMLGQNVKSSFTVDTDGPSTLLYFEDLQEGQTYNFQSVSNLVNLKTAVGYYPDYDYALNNVFVYDSGNLIGTLYSTGIDTALISTTKVLQLYVAKSIAELPKGAVFATDASNLANINYHFVQFVPDGSSDHSQTIVLLGDDTRAGALTIIGEKAGSSFDVRQFTPLDGNTAPFSYFAGGPMQSASSRVVIDSKKLPKLFHGNMNTFYVGSGKAIMKYTLV